jgi:hypothetical protein
MVNLDGNRNEAKFCGGVKRDGGPCRAYRLKDSEYCAAHDERMAAIRIQSMRDGYERSKAEPGKNLLKRASPRSYDLRKFIGRLPIKKVLQSVPQIESADDLRAYVCEVLPHIMSKDISTDRLRIVSDFLRVLQRTFETEESSPPQLNLLKAIGADDEATMQGAEPAAPAPAPVPDLPPAEEDVALETPGTFEDLEQASGGPILLDDIDTGDSGEERRPPRPGEDDDTQD